MVGRPVTYQQGGGVVITVEEEIIEKQTAVRIGITLQGLTDGLLSPPVMQTGMDIIRGTEGKGHQEEPEETTDDLVVDALQGMTKEVYAMNGKPSALQFADDTLGHIRPGGGLAWIAIGKDCDGSYRL